MKWSKMWAKLHLPTLITHGHYLARYTKCYHSFWHLTTSFQRKNKINTLTLLCTHLFKSWHWRKRWFGSISQLDKKKKKRLANTKQYEDNLDHHPLQHISLVEYCLIQHTKTTMENWTFNVITTCNSQSCDYYRVIYNWNLNSYTL